LKAGNSLCHTIFVNETCNSDLLKEGVEENIVELESMGLKILASVSGQCSHVLCFNGDGAPTVIAHSRSSL